MTWKPLPPQAPGDVDVQVRLDSSFAPVGQGRPRSIRLAGLRSAMPSPNWKRKDRPCPGARRSPVVMPDVPKAIRRNEPSRVGGAAGPSLGPRSSGSMVPERH